MQASSAVGPRTVLASSADERLRPAAGGDDNFICGRILIDGTRVRRVVYPVPDDDDDEDDEDEPLCWTPNARDYGIEE